MTRTILIVVCLGAAVASLAAWASYRRSALPVEVNTPPPPAPQANRVLDALRAYGWDSLRRARYRIVGPRGYPTTPRCPRWTDRQGVSVLHGSQWNRHREGLREDASGLARDRGQDRGRTSCRGRPGGTQMEGPDLAGDGSDRTRTWSFQGYSGSGACKRTTTSAETWTPGTGTSTSTAPITWPRSAHRPRTAASGCLRRT